MNICVYVCDTYITYVYECECIHVNVCMHESVLIGINECKNLRISLCK